MPYFGDVSLNSSAPDIFSMVVQVTNHTELWDDELTWYSPSITLRISLYNLEHGIGIYGFWSTWHWLITKVLAIRVKHLQQSGCCTGINCPTIFCATNIFGCFCSVMAKFEIGKHKFPNWTTLHVHQCGFKSHMEWSKVQYVSTLNTTTLPAIAGIFHECWVSFYVM